MQGEEKKRVGILRDGVGPYYEDSLRDGGEVIFFILENLSGKFRPIDILIDKDGAWHAGGVPIKPTDLLDKVDVVWNASHPNFSQALKDSLPFVSTSNLSRSLADSRIMLENHMKTFGIKMPRHFVLPVYQEDFDGPMETYAIRKAKEVFGKFSSPWIVKSFTNDADMGIHVAKTFPELADAIKDGVTHGKSILVEEFIEGKVVSAHAVRGFRGDLPAQVGDIYTFPFIELRSDNFVISPGNFSSVEKEELVALVKDLYKHLDVTHYLNSNFILSPTKGIYLISINFSPDLKQNSIFCQACESIGAKPHHLIEHMLESVSKI